MVTLLAKDKVASFDVDAQKGFTPICPSELPVPGGDEIAGELNAQAIYSSFRIGSKDAHSPAANWVATENNPQFSPVEGSNVDIRWNLHCVPGTEGFELLDDLPHPSSYQYFVYKGVEPDMHPYGACYHDLADMRSTGVIEVLKVAGIYQVIVGGLALDYCVKTTALQLAKKGFDVVVNLAACRGIAENTVTEAMEEMKNAGIRFVESAKELRNENA